MQLSTAVTSPSHSNCPEAGILSVIALVWSTAMREIFLWLRIVQCRRRLAQPQTEISFFLPSAYHPC